MFGCICVPRPDEDGEEIADLLLARERIGEWTLRVDQVGVASADALASDVTGVGELGADAVFPTGAGS